jgi:hypothetical protein
MRIGPLFIGWHAITEAERIALGINPLFGGWETLCIEWNRTGFMIATRPRRKRKHEVHDAQ